ncbi:DUF1810 domain-containing protein [Sphingobium sp. AN558]|uniref:DUF1810 domain-containing protein n=1 Tax=Sphingobium sp. AN558 TaxID=3133442 RepID=UPI0030BCE907
MIVQEEGLDRFIAAQEEFYPRALAELRAGSKRSHWMWFIFPQLKALGRSPIAQFYGIVSLAEARAYDDHPVLGARYCACVEALQGLSTSDPVAVMGLVDAMKLRSSLTLFEQARPASLLAAAIDRWFGGERDDSTLKLLEQER